MLCWLTSNDPRPLNFLLFNLMADLKVFFFFFLILNKKKIFIFFFLLHSLRISFRNCSSPGSYRYESISPGTKTSTELYCPAREILAFY